MCWLAALSDIEAGSVSRVILETGLEVYRGARIGELSLGIRQRLAIAGTLLGDPGAVLFDEPLNGLDVPGIVWFRELLGRLADEQKTVVVATHLLGEVALTADRIAILDRGRLTAAGALGAVVPAGADRRQWLEQALMACA
jgi:ABC-2 type transport system ATP-binding protein